MSDYDTITNHLDNTYSDNELLDYTKRNGLYKHGMNRQDMIGATAKALHSNGYRVGFTREEKYHRKPKEYRWSSLSMRDKDDERVDSWAQRRSLGKTQYANSSGNAEVAIGSPRRSGSQVLRRPVTAGELEYQRLQQSGQLESYEKEIEATERSYQNGHRRRRSRHKIGPVPSSPQDCPAGTYYREGYYRDPTMVNFNGKLIPRRGSYVEATCADEPRGNPWWEEIHEYAQEHPGVSGAEAAQDLSREMAAGEIPHRSIYSSPRRSRSPARVRVGSNNTAYASVNAANVGAANVGSYGAGMQGTGSEALGTYA
jgi:hypothetical protein